MASAKALKGVETSLKSDEWEIRVEGLKALLSLGEAAANDAPELKRNFAHLLRSEGVADLVAKQLRDLRSVVANAACRCATGLATSLGAEASPVLDSAWTATLLAVVASGAPKMVLKVAFEAAVAVVAGAAPKGHAPLFARLCETAAHARDPRGRKAAIDLASAALGAWEPAADMAHAGDHEQAGPHRRRDTGTCRHPRESHR